MPNILIRVPEGVLDAERREKLAKAATTVAKTVEQGGDDPRQAALTWVAIDEVKASYFFAGGKDPLKQMIPVVVFFHYPAGVLDDAARAEAARLFQEVISAARRPGDSRPVATSVIMTEVADGLWGASGRVVRLPDLAKAAGYKHLQHLVVA